MSGGVFSFKYGTVDTIKRVTNALCIQLALCSGPNISKTWIHVKSMEIFTYEKLSKCTNVFAGLGSN